MLAITSEIGVVIKGMTLQINKNSSYKAVGESDVLTAIKPLEKKYGVLSYPCNRRIIKDEILEVEKAGYNGAPSRWDRSCESTARPRRTRTKFLSGSWR